MNHLYAHPRKSGANAVVREYVNMMTNRDSATIRFMRMDGEKTLRSEFDNLVRDKGITIERSAPATKAGQSTGELERIRHRGVLDLLSRSCFGLVMGLNQPHRTPALR